MDAAVCEGSVSSQVNSNQAGCCGSQGSCSFICDAGIRGWPSQQQHLQVAALSNAADHHLNSLQVYDVRGVVLDSRILIT